jgi:predicted amidohydrolase
LIGSIPERDPSGKIFNTLTAYDPNGNMIAKHRKVHLFDIDVPGKIKFKVKTDEMCGDYSFINKFAVNAGK